MQRAMRTFIFLCIFAHTSHSSSSQSAQRWDTLPSSHTSHNPLAPLIPAGSAAVCPLLKVAYASCCAIATALRVDRVLCGHGWRGGVHAHAQVSAESVSTCRHGGFGGVHAHTHGLWPTRQAWLLHISGPRPRLCGGVVASGRRSTAGALTREAAGLAKEATQTLLLC